VADAGVRRDRDGEREEVERRRVAQRDAEQVGRANAVDAAEALRERPVLQREVVDEDADRQHLDPANGELNRTDQP